MFLLMAYHISARVMPCAVAVATAAGGLVAQTDPTPSVGQIGVGTSIIGATYLIIAVIREGSPLFHRTIETIATARNDRVRLETRLELLTEQHAADSAEIVAMRARIEVAEQEAREAKNQVENARIEVEARTEAIEGRAREAGHMARNNAQRLQNVEDTLASSSGEREPVS